MKTTFVFVIATTLSLTLFGSSHASTSPTIIPNKSAIQIRAGEALLAIDNEPLDHGTSQVRVTGSSPNGFWPFLLGDVIKKINGKPITQPNDLIFMFRESAGSTLHFEILRNNKVTLFTAGPKEFPGLALPATPTPPVPPTRPTK